MQRVEWSRGADKKGRRLKTGDVKNESRKSSVSGEILKRLKKDVNAGWNVNYKIKQI